MNWGRNFQLFTLLFCICSGAYGQNTLENNVTTLIDSLPQTVGGVAVDALGYIYVADFEETVWRVNPFTKKTEIFATGFYGASGNAFDNAGRLYQASINGNYISRVARDGSIELFADSLLSSPVGISMNAQNELFVCNCGDRSITKINSAGESTAFAKSDLMYCPNGITQDASGNLFVVSFHNNNVVKISPKGEVSLFAQTPDKIGNGHIALSNNTLYVTGFHGHRVYQITMKGEVSILAGTGERGVDNGSALTASFSYPNGIAVSTNGKTLYINDMVTANYGEPALSPSKSSLRTIKLYRFIDLIKGEIDTNGLESAKKLFNTLRSSPDFENQISRLELNTLGYNYMMVGETDQALLLFDLSLDLYPDWFLTYSFRGRSLYIASKPKEALKNFKKAFELNPNYLSLLPIIKELEKSN